MTAPLILEECEKDKHITPHSQGACREAHISEVPFLEHNAAYHRRSVTENQTRHMMYLVQMSFSYILFEYYACTVLAYLSYMYRSCFRIQMMMVACSITHVQVTLRRAEMVAIHKIKIKNNMKIRFSTSGKRRIPVHENFVKPTFAVK